MEKKTERALKLFQLVEQFMMGTFLLKLGQFENTGSTGKTFFQKQFMIGSFDKIYSTGVLGKIFIALENLKTKFYFRN